MSEPSNQQSVALLDKPELTGPAQNMAVEYAVRFLTNEINDLEHILERTPNKDIIRRLIKEYKQDLSYMDQFIVE